MSKPLWLFLEVNPEPWAVGPLQTFRNKGKIGARMGRNQQLAAYQEAVREAVRDQWGELPTLQGNMVLEVYLWRSRANYTTDADRKHRKHEADATNMLKALEDALQGVLFDNDRDNISVTSHIMQQGADVQPKVIVRLEVVDPVEHRRKLIQKLPGGMMDKIVRSEMNFDSAQADLSWGSDEEVF